MKKIILLFAFAFTSCSSVSTYYQVYQTKSENVQTGGNGNSFENSHCKIDYNLWANYGNPGFSFYNKTDENIYLLLEECFYVINDKAYDYYQNRGFTNSSYVSSFESKTISATKIGGLPLAIGNSKAATSSNSNSIAITESRVVIIPPKAYKTIAEFDIAKTVYRDCDLLRFPTSRQTSSKSFTEATTPLKFYNSLTYRIGNNGAQIRVKNDFYVSQISNYSENEMFRLQKNEYCNQKSGFSDWVFKNKSPDQFYIRYEKAQGSSWKY